MLRVTTLDPNAGDLDQRSFKRQMNCLADGLQGSVTSTVELSLTPEQAFDVFTDEVTFALLDRGMKFEETSRGRILSEGDTVVGTVKEWNPGKRISLLWHPLTWDNAVTTELSITFITGKEGGTTVSVEQNDWGRVIGGEAKELLGWFVNETAAPFVSATAPNRLGDWITDRRARRPTGEQSGSYYRDPTHHWPNFLAILDLLALRPTDRLLEVGCGGGAFLHEALQSGCSAAAVDHSPYMVRLASEVNKTSIAEGKLSIGVAEADSLPYADGTYTCVAMTGVFSFIANPLLAFKEIFRVLQKGGRFVVYTGSKDLRETPAAPEPIASRLHFYEDEEIVHLARLAGFGAARVEHPSLYEYAKKSGVPESDLGMFSGTKGSQMLIASKT